MNQPILTFAYVSKGLVGSTTNWRLNWDLGFFLAFFGMVLPQSHITKPPSWVNKVDRGHQLYNSCYNKPLVSGAEITSVKPHLFSAIYRGYAATHVTPLITRIGFENAWPFPEIPGELPFKSSLGLLKKTRFFNVRRYDVGRLILKKQGGRVFEQNTQL